MSTLNEPPEGRDGSDGGEPEPPGFHQLLQYLRAEIRAGGYHTNAIVELVGDFTSPVRYLQINAAPPIPLQRPEFLVLLVIMARQLTARGLPSPRRIESGTYLTGKEILNALQDWAKTEPAAAWDAVDETVHKVINKIRDKLGWRGYRKLIETRAKAVGGGYRLSTPPFNLIITGRPARLP